MRDVPYKEETPDAINPAKIATRPLPNIAIENVCDSHSSANPRYVIYFHKYKCVAKFVVLNHIQHDAHAPSRTQTQRIEAKLICQIKGDQVEVQKKNVIASSNRPRSIEHQK